MSIKREILTGLGLALTILLLVFLVQDASAHPRRHGKATKRAVKAWKHAKSPLPVHPISHSKNGTLKTGDANAYGD